MTADHLYQRCPEAPKMRSPSVYRSPVWLAAIPRSARPSAFHLIPMKNVSYTLGPLLPLSFRLIELET